MNVCVNMASLYHISHSKPSRNHAVQSLHTKLLNFAGLNCTVAKCSAIFSMLFQYVPLVKNIMFVCGVRTTPTIILFDRRILTNIYN